MKDERKLSTSDIAAANERDNPPDSRTARRIGLEGETAHAHADRRPPQADAPRQDDDPVAQLFAAEDAAGYRTRWSGIQTGFVDEPRRAVEEADTLVAEVMKRLAEGFANERRELETRWEKTDQVSTEDLRLAMRRYRTFFERLLTV
jgi:hypothetical protein